MKCAQCNYVLDIFDTQCPQCSRGGKSASVIPSRHAVVGTTQSLLETARVTRQNAEEKKRSISRAATRYTFIGIALALVAAIPLGLALTFFRYIDLLLVGQAKLGQIFSPLAALLTYAAGGVPFLGLGIGAALFIGHHWQSLALAHPETKGSYSHQAKSIAAGIALLIGLIFLVWQYFDSHSNFAPTYGSGLLRLFNGANSILVTVVFVFVLIILGALVGCSWGQMVGTQNHERRLLGETEPAGQPVSQKTVVGSANKLLNSDWGTRIVVVVSFLVPWIGVIFYLVYNNKDQEKTRAASRGIVGGISFVLPCVGILFYMAYANSDEEKAQSAAWGLGLSFVFFVIYVFLRLLGQS